MFRCKYISKIDIESRGLYNFCETHLVFEDPETRSRMINKSYWNVNKFLFFGTQSCRWTDECNQSIKSKIFKSNLLWKPVTLNVGLSWTHIQGIWRANSRATVSISSYFNTPKLNCCLGKMANALHLRGDTKCEDVFKKDMDKHWLCLHQKLF